MTDSPAETAMCADPVRNALLEAAAGVYAYLRKEGSPPIWYKAVDLIHERAGSLWVEGDDGNDGGYVCPSCGRSVEDGPCGKAKSMADLAVPVDRTPLDIDGEPYATRLWHEVERLRAEKVRGDDATRDCIRGLRSEVERLRSDLAEAREKNTKWFADYTSLAHECGGEMVRLAAQVERVEAVREALCAKARHRPISRETHAFEVALILLDAALAVPAATEETAHVSE